jgi:hypothetical protein
MWSPKKSSKTSEGWRIIHCDPARISSSQFDVWADFEP